MESTALSPYFLVFHVLV